MPIIYSSKGGNESNISCILFAFVLFGSTLAEENTFKDLTPEIEQKCCRADAV